MQASTRRVLALPALAALALLLSACAPLGMRSAPPAGTATAAGAVFDAGAYPVEVCDAAYAGQAARCTVSGQGTRLLLRGNLVSDGRLYVGGTLAVAADGRIQSAGCERPQAADATVLDCPGALVSPGLINLHEHIDYSYQQPPRPPTLTWQHRNEWRRLSAAERGFEGDAPKDKAVATEVSERAMLRHALSGSTAISGAKDYRGFLRNLKAAEPAAPSPFANPLGLGLLDSTFPLNDAASMRILDAPCTPDEVAAVKLSPAHPYIPHVGEGTAAGARHEVDCVLDAIRSKITPSAFIHGVAIGPHQVARLKQQSVAVVLSPRSNLQLYGATAPVAELRAAGVTLALGTDWSPSGSLTLLDEARCLARYDADHGGSLRASDLLDMMTRGGAQAVGLGGQLGALSPGQWADLVILDTEGRRSLGEILQRAALPQTVAVMVAGRLSSGPADWLDRVPQLDHCAVDPRQLCGQARLVCGADEARPLGQLLQQAAYTLDDGRLCRPQPTDDCVTR